MTTKKVLILDGAIYRDIYKPTDHWQRLLGEVPSDSVHLPSFEKIPDISGYTHIIVTGSEASILQAAPWFALEAAVIREAVEKDIPILGSCFGHQMLFDTLSGPEYVGRMDTPELGWANVEVTSDDPLLDGIPSSFNVFVSHFDEAKALRGPWTILARNESCAVHIARFGGKPVWGVQSHPEITPVDGKALLIGLSGRMPDHADRLLEVAAQDSKDDGIAERLVSNFLGV